LLWHLYRLRRARVDGKLVFVLGSGINRSYGLPDWRGLLEQLLRDSERVRGGNNTVDSQISTQLQSIVPDPLLQAAIGRQGYASSELWIDAIGRHLRAPQSPVDRTKPLSHIARIVTDQYFEDTGRHVAILTYNYDDLLEEALRAEAGARAEIRSISRGTDYAASIYRAGIFVYHLHGDVNSKESPILDAASYLRVLGAPGRHWSWDCLAATLFQRGAAAMFIGLSLVDPSLRLMLTQWAEKGFPLSGIFVSAPPPEPDKTLDLEDRLRVARISRDILHLFDEVLVQLSLIPYHVTVWDEINELLKVISEDEFYIASGARQ